jgi:hypothetical protein
MLDTDIQPTREVVTEDPSVESRRKFLKVSVAAGAAVAAVAAGVHFMPSLESSAKSKAFASELAPAEAALASVVPSRASSDAMILVIEGDLISLYKGEDKYVTNDLSFARQISSAVRARL